MTMPESNEIVYDTTAPTQESEIGYPVHVCPIELCQMYMQRIRWHWHPEIEIIIITAGEADFLMEDKKIRLKTGQGIIINQNVMHSVVPENSNADCRLYSVAFHPSFLFGYGNTTISGKFLVPILSSPFFRTMLLDEKEHNRKKLLDIINNVISTNLAKAFGYELTTKSYLCAFWLCLLECVIPQNIKKDNHIAVSPDEARVKDAILYIEKHYFEPVSLEQLADSIHISKSECCRCFKRVLQISPIEYLMKYRIFQAANMIQRNDPNASSMSELAFSVGFNNASYFNKVFKSFLDCTPSEYRKNLKTDPTRNPFIIN